MNCRERRIRNRRDCFAFVARRRLGGIADTLDREFAVLGLDHGQVDVDGNIIRCRAV